MIDEKFDKLLLIDIGEAEYSSTNIADLKELIAVGTPIFMSPEIY